MRWPHGDPRDVARAVLADPRFQHAAQGPAPRPWWDVLLDPLRALWHALTGPIGHLLGNQALTAFIGGVVLAAVLVGLVLVIVRLLPPGLRPRFRDRSALPADALPEETSAAALRMRARAAAAAGRYHEAAALLWVSALHALDEAGRVRYDPARTPGEWRRAVAVRAFDGFARDAVVALFGDRDPEPSLVARMDATYDAAIGTRG